LTDLDANLLAEKTYATPPRLRFGPVMEQTAGIIEELMDHTGSRKKNICGIGLAVAGVGHVNVCSQLRGHLKPL